MLKVNEESILMKQNVTEIVGITETGSILITVVNFFILLFGLLGKHWTVAWQPS